MVAPSIVVPWLTARSNSSDVRERGFASVRSPATAPITSRATNPTPIQSFIVPKDLPHSRKIGLCVHAYRGRGRLNHLYLRAVFECSDLFKHLQLFQSG